MTKCGNFLCFLVQLRLKITRLTPIFVRLKATARIHYNHPTITNMLHYLSYKIYLTYALVRKNGSIIQILFGFRAKSFAFNA